MKIKNEIEELIKIQNDKKCTLQEWNEKYLGVIIDKNLNFINHMAYILDKIIIIKKKNIAKWLPRIEIILGSNFLKEEFYTLPPISINYRICASIIYYPNLNEKINK